MKYLIFLACLGVLPAWAAPGVMLKDEDLRAAPNATAASLGRLAKQTSVEIVSRQGGWSEVVAAGRRGWVRILSVRASAPSTGANFSALLQAGTRRSDSSRVVATAGLRGLDEAQLKAARYDARELVKLDGYRMDRAGAEQYARAVGLRPRDLAYLPEPRDETRQREESSSPWGEGGFL